MDNLNCIRCGACLAVCPTYREHLCETAPPCGRVEQAQAPVAIAVQKRFKAALDLVNVLNLGKIYPD